MMEKQCKPLVNKYCSDSQMSKRALMKCLNDNKDKEDVPSVCRTVLEDTQVCFVCTHCQLKVNI